MAHQPGIPVPTGKEPVLAGPLSFFDGSFIVEILEPAKELNASVLLKATYVYNHLLNNKETASPQSPPYHLHLSQTESFVVLSGAIGTTTTYARTQTIHTAETTSGSTPFSIGAYVPHTFWPVASNANGEDSVLLLWAHPSHAESPSSDSATAESDMDGPFFRAILQLSSDLYEGKQAMTPGAIGRLMRLQHESRSVSVWAPGLWWLGPLRWRVPWVLEGMMAWLATVFGSRAPLVERDMLNGQDSKVKDL